MLRLYILAALLAGASGCGPPCRDCSATAGSRDSAQSEPNTPRSEPGRTGGDDASVIRGSSPGKLALLVYFHAGSDEYVVKLNVNIPDPPDPFIVKGSFDEVVQELNAGALRDRDVAAGPLVVSGDRELRPLTREESEAFRRSLSR
jgi:hypothetical protein